MKIIPILFLLLNSVYCMDYKGNYFGFIPDLKAVVKEPEYHNLETECFKNIQFSLLDDVLNVELSGKKNFICSDTYMFSDHYRLFIKNFFLEGKHHIELKNMVTDEKKDIQYYGFNIFHFKNGLIGSLMDIYKTSKLFVGSEENIEKENIEFVKQMMDHEFVLWNKTIDIREEEIVSGDYISITRLDGLDPMIMWGTGSYSGHTGVALRINGTLYICESTDDNPFGKSYWPPPYGIIKTPYKTWIELAKKANYMVTILRLDPKYQAIFNNNINKALSFFNDVEGLPYGKHNFLYGWIDTTYNNYPNNLTHQFITNVASVASEYNFAKHDIDIFATEALNKRLSVVLGKKTNLTFQQIVNKTIDIDYPIYELMNIPENDNWIYSIGKSMVCNTFVTAMYKSVGIFSQIDDQIQATEFSPRDSYLVNIFDNNWLPKKCDNGNGLCQIMGKYKVILPGFNTIKMYQNMNDKCPSMAPKYLRPDNC